MSIIDRLKKPKTAEKPTKARAKKADAVVETTVTNAATAMTTGNAYRVLLRPVLSEKSVSAEARGTYTFAVAMNATKPAIKDAIASVYGVRPVSVRVIHTEGKEVRFGRSQGRRNHWKKAMVTLPKGKTITIHHGV